MKAAGFILGVAVGFGVLIGVIRVADLSGAHSCESLHGKWDGVTGKCEVEIVTGPHSSARVWVRP